MLKNWIHSIKVRNFFKTGLFMDLSVKKISNFLIKNAIKIGVLFNEKFVLEFVLKNLKDNIPLFERFQIQQSYKFFNILFIVVNFMFFCFLILCV